MWVIRQGNVEALGKLSGLRVYIVHIHRVYIVYIYWRRKMLEHTWSKIAIVELPLMVVCRRCASEWVTSV